MRLDIEQLLRKAARPTYERIERELANLSPKGRLVLRCLRDHLFDADFGATDLRRLLGKKVGDVLEVFRMEVGDPVTSYLAKARLETASRLLRDTDIGIASVGFLVGYSDAAAFRAAFKRSFNLSPQAFRRSAKEVGAILPGVEILSILFWREFDSGELSDETLLALLERLRTKLKLELPSVDEEESHGSFEERFVGLLIDKLSTGAPAIRKALKNRELRINSFAILELLSRKSIEVGRKDRRLGVELAEIAVAGVRGAEDYLGEGLFALRALGWARLGETRRLALDYEGADAAFVCAEEGLPLIQLKGKCLYSYEWVSAEVLERKGTLRIFQRRYQEAVGLIEQAIELCERSGHGVIHIKALIQRAKLADYCRQHLRAVGDLTVALELLQQYPDSYVEFVVYNNLAVSYVWEENYQTALSVIPEVIQRWHRLSPESKRRQWCHLLWIKGLANKGIGNGELGERFIREAYVGFREIGEAGYAAVAALDLAACLRVDSNRGEILRLASESIPILRNLEHLPETQVALELLAQAISTSSISIAVLSKVRLLMYQLYREPHSRLA